MFGKELINILNERKKQGEMSLILTAKDIEVLLDVSNRCGGEPNSRYPLICRAMEYASEIYPSKWIDGKNPSCTFKVEYKLN